MNDRVRHVMQLFGSFKRAPKQAGAGLLGLMLLLSVSFLPGVRSPVQTAIASSAYAPWTPDGSVAGYRDTQDYSNGGGGEYGVDVPLGEGTPIYAPESGWVQFSACGGCNYCWPPGRMGEQTDSGAFVGFGHVQGLSQYSDGSSHHVAGGTEIATVHSTCYAAHVEFMYSASGSTSSRSYFVPSSTVGAGNPCPLAAWSGGGSGVDPCAVLTSYLHGNSPTGVGQPILVDNGTYTFVADHNHLRKYADGGTGVGYLTGSDQSGLTGSTCPHANTAYYCVGYADMGATITALAIDGSILFIGLSTGRVIKTNMCGTGGNVCAFSDNMGTGSLSGYGYWVGEMDLAGSIEALAANSSYLYSSFGTRTVKTTLCGTGSNMCALSNTSGTSGLSGYNYWVGYQDWSWPVVAQGANDAYVFTSLSGSGSNRTCKTDLGTSGADVFWLNNNACTSGVSPHWFGYQDMAVPVVGLSVDQKYVWWSLASTATPRLIQTNMCSSGGNVCAFTDSYGSGSLSGYSSWQGRQDWCSGYSGASVSTWNFYEQPATYSSVNAVVTIGNGAWRIVKSINGQGVNTLRTSDCTGTGAYPNTTNWSGSQDFSF